MPVANYYVEKDSGNANVTFYGQADGGEPISGSPEINAGDQETITWQQRDGESGWTYYGIELVEKQVPAENPDDPLSEAALTTVKDDPPLGGKHFVVSTLPGSPSSPFSLITQNDSEISIQDDDPVSSERRDFEYTVYIQIGSTYYKFDPLIINRGGG